MIPIHDTEYRNQRDGTNFPFAERATLTNGSRQLPTGLFLDASLYPVGGKAGLFLSEVEIDNQNVNLFIGNAGQTRLCSTEFSLINPPANLLVTDTLGRDAGLLISESSRLAAFQSWGAGDYLFTQDQTEFAAVVCTPLPEIALRGILLDDGTLVSGDVWLVGSEGVILSVDNLAAPHIFQPPPQPAPIPCGTCRDGVYPNRWDLTLSGFTGDWAVLNGSYYFQEGDSGSTLPFSSGTCQPPGVCVWETPWIRLEGSTNTNVGVAVLLGDDTTLGRPRAFVQLQIFGEGILLAFEWYNFQPPGQLDCTTLSFSGSLVPQEPFRYGQDTQSPTFSLTSTGGTNVRCPPSDVQEAHFPGIPAIRVDVVGDPLFRRRLCAANNLFETPRPIRELLVLAPNAVFTVRPDSFGNIQFLAGDNLAPDTVLRLGTGGDGILQIGIAGAS